MSTERKLSSDKDERHAAFLTYARADGADFVKNFAAAFEKTLETRNVGRKIFFDQWRDDKSGPVDQYFREHASRADYLVIFVGDQYPQRDFCLLEWKAFRSQFKDKGKALNRLITVEIDPDAVDRLGYDAPLSDSAEADERAAVLKANFQKSMVDDENGQRVVSREGGKISEKFQELVKGHCQVDGLF